MDNRPFPGKRQLLQMAHLITQTMACTGLCESMQSVILCSRWTQVWEPHPQHLAFCLDCAGTLMARLHGWRCGRHFITARSLPRPHAVQPCRQGWPSSA